MSGAPRHGAPHHDASPHDASPHDASPHDASPHDASAGGAAAGGVRLDGVEKAFGDVRAVDGISLDLRPGRLTALLGPNGAGKTTVMDLILGLQTADRGGVTVLGGTPADAAARGEVGAVLQDGGLLPDLTVTETLRYVASLHHDPLPVPEALELAGLRAVARRRVGACSGGERRRLHFALALLGRPRLLVLDEPTAGLDVTGRRQFWDAVGRLPGRPTVLFATHHLDEAERYAEQVVVIAAGRVAAEGTPAEIRGHAAGRVVRVHWPDADLAALRALPAVERVDQHGPTVTVRTRDSDLVVRHLAGTAAREIEVGSAGLEEAFLALAAAVPPPARAQD
ncbi:ABC transporter ATP-binding protein [Actinacidiphila yeochonensis]|uniref:ABC transporter ATP-binding protein n=1 Tax=Actinacidiphila yeochonensis TaxID=89050 RepID=UPI000AE28A9F|nr:ATP-binding cassette domain-containing protein [Actinacidiphila yeochonensis]